MTLSPSNRISRIIRAVIGNCESASVMSTRVNFVNASRRPLRLGQIHATTELANENPIEKWLRHRRSSDNRALCNQAMRATKADGALPDYIMTIIVRLAS